MADGDVGATRPQLAADALTAIITSSANALVAGDSCFGRNTRSSVVLRPEL
jgi:hypothetical protein